MARFEGVGSGGGATNGGTITWYLDADDSGFDAVARKVRAEARLTGKAVDKDIKRGTDRAGESLNDFRVHLARTASFVRNFQVATRGFNMTTMILGVTAAAGLVVELGAAVVASTGSLLALPGILASVGAAFGTTRVALLGLDNAIKYGLKGDTEKLTEAMKQLSPAAQDVVRAIIDIRNSFDPIKKAVQEAFFADIGNQMRSVAQTSAPILQAGMTNVAKAINGVLKEAAAVAKEPFFQGMVANSFNTAAQATTTLQSAVRPLSEALAGLVNVGLPFTNMLAEWTVKLSQQAAAYVNSEHGQQQLTAAINLGIDALQKIGNLAISVGQFFVELFKISNKEGLSMIDTLTQIIDKMTAWLKTDEGQKLMASLLRVTNEVLLTTLQVAGDVALVILHIISALDSAPEPIQNLIIGFLAWTAVLTPVITYLSSLAGSLGVAGKAIKEVSDALGLTGPIVKVAASGFRIIQVVFLNIARIVATQVIPTLLRMGAAFLVAIGPIGWVILAVIAIVGVFILLWNKVDAFRNFWISVWEHIKGAASAVADWFTTTVVPFFAAGFGQLQQWLQVFVNFWQGVWNSIVSIAQSVFSFIMVIAQPFIAIFSAIMFVLNALFQIWVTVWTGILQIAWIVISTIVQIIGVILYGTFLWLWNNVLVPTGRLFADIFNAIKDVVVSVLTTVGNFITTIFSAVWNFIVGILTGIKNFFVSIWQSIYNAVAAPLQSVWNVVVNIFNSIASFVSSVWNNIRNTIVNAVTSLVSTVVSKFNEVKNAVTNALNAALDAARAFVDRFVSVGRDIINGIVRGVAGGKDAVVGKVREIASASLDSVKSFFGIHSPSRVMAQMGNYMMEGLQKGIMQAGVGVVEATQSVAGGIASTFGRLDGTNISTSVTNDVADVSGVSRAVGKNIQNSTGGGTIENHIGNINIGSEVDGQNWLQKLTREDEITRTGLVAA